MDDLFTGDYSGAIFSPCRTWRYVLWRTWDKSQAPVMFIGLNPSTADESEDDPTIRRCIGFAKSWGYGGLLMLNIFAFRATLPEDMRKADDPVGPENNTYLKQYASEAGIVVAAWGCNGMHFNREPEVKEMIQPLYCLGVTQAGHPKHPLYLRGDLTPIPYTR